MSTWLYGFVVATHCLVIHYHIDAIAAMRSAYFINDLDHAEAMCTTECRPMHYSITSLLSIRIIFEFLAALILTSNIAPLAVDDHT